MRLAILAALALLAGCGPQTAPGPRHVILISLDTFRADHMGAYGSERALTPRLDRLAASGVRFQHALTPAPTTLAAHTSILTGRYPHTHGVYRNGLQVPDGNVLLAEVLGNAGFHTAAVVGGFPLERRFGLARGFAHYGDRFEDVRYGHDERPAAAVTDAALAHLDSGAAADRRLFLFAHYFDAHSPYDPPAAWRRAAGADSAASGRLADVTAAVKAHHRAIGVTDPAVATVGVGLTRALLARADGTPLPADEPLTQLYEGEVAYVDAEVGRLLDGLDARGWLDDAVVIVTADHGETFFEHADFWNHGLWVFDTTVRVPLVIRLPGDEGGGRVVMTPVSTVDVVPTLLELLGLTTGQPSDGLSLVPALHGTTLARGPVFSEATQPFLDASTRPGEWRNARVARAVRAGDHKLIRAPYLRDFEQLFDIASDPLENEDLIQQKAMREEGAALRQKLAAWDAQATPLRATRPTADAEDTRARLRALGYLEE